MKKTIFIAGQLTELREYAFVTIVTTVPWQRNFLLVLYHSMHLLAKSRL